MARATGPGRRLRGRPASARRGARRTTRTDTVISWRLYRAGWLAVLPALLLMLVAARTPATLPAATLPETFDGAEALGYATEFVTANPDRAPGSGGAQRAADWLADRLEAVRPALHVSRDRFQATDAGGGQVELENVLAVVPGESNEAVILLARRDGKSPGPGADYSGSGTGLLLAMATALAGTTSAKTFVLASVDGSLLANAGARRLAEGLPDGLRAVAAVALDGGGRDLPVALRIEGDDARRPAAGLVRSAETALAAHGISEIAPPGAGEQLARFYTPLGIGPQAAFVTDAVPSVALDRANDDLSPTRDTLRALSADELGDFGSSGQALAFALAEGPRPVSHGATYVLSGDRVVRGWTIQLLILSLLVPPGLVLLDLIVRGRRRGLPLRPALRAVGLRTLPPLAFVVALRLEGALGAFSGPHEPPFPLGAAGVRPVWLVVPALAAIGAMAWARPRRQTVPGDPAEAGLAAYTAALTAAGVAAFLLELGGGYPAVVAAVALHVWLTLPALAPAGAAARLGAVALGWAGLAAVIALTAAPGGLGRGAPGWLVRLAGSGAIPFAAAAGIAVLAGATAALVAIVVARGGESGRSGLQ